MSDKERDEELSRRERELDDFWELGELVRSLADAMGRRTPTPRRETPEGVEIELTARQTPPAGQGAGSRPVQDAPLSPRPTPAGRGDAAADQLGKPHYVPPHKAEPERTPAFSYEADGLLIHRVEVYEWRSDYRYFNQFIQDAADYAARTPPDTKPKRESFFSYFPQYAQLNRRQAMWYLWWREQVRNGSFPDTDYAYILLYIFELINLPPSDRTAAQTTARRLAEVWMTYRRRAPQLDHYMCEWLCDFCLIHGLPVPGDILAPALDDIVKISSLKEFYLSAAIIGGEQDTAGARILLRHCCQYDYHKSKFAGGEHAALFDRIIPGAVAHAMPLLLGRAGQPPLVTMQDSTVTRDAYTGALCAYQNKRRITVSYTSFSRSHDLRFLIGDMVKHIENRLRKYIGVRSRLSTMALPTAVRDALDAYLDPLLPEAMATPPPKKQSPRAAWESLYDLPSKPVSSEDAARIEADSWETTRILTEAFGGKDGAEELPPVEVDAESAPPPPDATAVSDGESPSEPQNAEEETSGGMAAELVAFLRLALAGDAVGQRELAGRSHTLPDALADRINEWAVGSEIGDVILEDTGEGYAVIEDYVTDVENILLSADTRQNSDRKGYAYE